MDNSASSAPLEDKLGRSADWGLAHRATGQAFLYLANFRWPFNSQPPGSLLQEALLDPLTGELIPVLHVACVCFWVFLLRS